jgi:hypothetical protein
MVGNTLQGTALQFRIVVVSKTLCKQQHCKQPCMQPAPQTQTLEPNSGGELKEQGSFAATAQ